jgi:predicted metalloprotease with PDZ domain
MRRAGLYTDAQFATEMGNAINRVVTAPGRRFRSAVEVSQHAAFWDAATSIDPTNFDNTFVSYYTWGQAIALGLDLALRERSDGRITLDDFMRAMWTGFGTSAAKSAGLVERPYTIADLKATLASISGDAAFASDFFARYIEGRDVVDYAPLLARAGFVLRPTAPERAFAGAFPLQDAQRGARVADLVPAGSPAYAAGLERGDIVTSIGGTRVMRADDVDRVLGTSKPGDALALVFERRGQQVNATLRLVGDPRVELVPAEQAGQPLSDAQRRFREAWLSSAGRNAF